MLGMGLAQGIVGGLLGTLKTSGGEWIGLNNSKLLAAIGAAWFGAIASACVCGLAAVFGLPLPVSVLSCY